MAERPPFILLLCESETAANIDRRALREAGFPNPLVMTSGGDAARLLAGLENAPADLIPDIAICRHHLGDMTGLQFCAIIREHPRLACLPVLLILPNNSETERLKTIDSGASSVLARPYSIDMLKKALDQLSASVPAHRKQWAENADADSNEFEGALITQGVLLRSEKSPADFFKLGMRLLNESNWSMAIAAFEKALKEPDIRAEVEMGLAAANRGSGNTAEFKKWLARACDTFVAKRRWNRARSAYAKLLQLDPTAKNPFLSEAHRMIRQGSYQAAAQALVQGHNLLPKMKVAERYASACMTAPNPQEMCNALEAELDREGELAFLGNELRNNLNGQLRQREKRQREMAAERAFKLARNMGWPLDENQQTDEIPDAVIENQEMPKTSKPNTPSQHAKPVAAQKTATPTRQPQVPELAVQEFETSAQPDDDLFQGKSVFSDFMSMIRLTWRLNKKSSRK